MHTASSLSSRTLMHNARRCRFWPYWYNPLKVITLLRNSPLMYQYCSTSISSQFSCCRMFSLQLALPWVVDIFPDGKSMVLVYSGITITKAHCYTMNTVLVPVWIWCYLTLLFTCFWCGTLRILCQVCNSNIFLFFMKRTLLLWKDNVFFHF